MTIALTITWVLLFGFRLALEWLTDKFEFFRQWLIIATVALIVVSVVLAISLITYIAEQIAKWRNIIPKKSETQQAQAQETQRKKEKERGETRSERRAQRAARRSWREAQRNKIQRVEAYEKRWRRERGGR